MQGDVGFLGGYYDDNGVNLMHDNWAEPMSAATRAILNLVHEEGPDLLANLHSHGNPPTLLSLHHVPPGTRGELRDLAGRVYSGLERAGIPHGSLPRLDETDEQSYPPPLNLTSLFYHVGAGLPFTFECPHGLSDYEPAFDHRQILEALLILFWELAGGP